MPGEVSAIHGGNVPGLERVKVGRVIPIEEVTAKQFQAAHGCQCCFQPLHCLQCAQPPEITRRKYG